MLVKQKKVRNLDKYTALVNSADLIVGVMNPSEKVLRSLGFSGSDTNGTTILPLAIGPISMFNAEGKEQADRSQSMETAYRTAEWHWSEWHGRDTIPRSKFVDVPYKRYPRNFVPPPSIELTLTTDHGGNRVLICPTIIGWKEKKELLLHCVNLLLEVSGECSFFDGDMNQFIKAPLSRLNWRVLPPGKRPWQTLKNDIKPILGHMPIGRKVVAEHRLQTINSYQPTFTAVGEGGFSGYIILGFPEKNLYMLESLFYGNATYVFGEQWKQLSQKTKAEILIQNLQNDRIIHRKGWEERIHSSLNLRRKPS